MSINKKSLRALIKESLEQARSEQAIDHAKGMREDGLSFQDFIEALLDYLEDKTDQQWSEENLSDDWNYYDEWLKGSDPYSIGAEYLADAYLQEKKMKKININQLRMVIKEAMGKLNEDDVQMEPGGNWGQPQPGERQHELVPGSVEDIANSIMDLMAEANLSHNDAVDVLNQIAIEMGLNEPEEEKPPIGFRENLREALIKENLKRALTNALKK